MNWFKHQGHVTADIQYKDFTLEKPALIIRSLAIIISMIVLLSITEPDFRHNFIF